MKKTFGLYILWFTSQTLIGLQIGYAQESGNDAAMDTGQSELAYFLGQQDATKAAGSKLQAAMDDLQKKYAADPNVGLREQVREQEAFANRLQNLRSEAKRFVNPTLLPTLDWLVRDAQESINNLKTYLNARLHSPSTDRIALKGQIDKLQKEIDLNNKLVKTLADKIKSMQDDRRSDGLASELDALIKPGGPEIISNPTTAANAVSPKKER